jgi:hypothetical protein
MKKITLLLLLAISTHLTAQLNESFDTTEIPSGWTVSDGIWASGATANGNSSVSPRTGAGMALFLTSTAGATSVLSTPSQDLTSFASPVLTFYYTTVNWFGDIDDLNVYYKDSASGPWTLIQTYTAEVTDWLKVDITLPNPSADYYIGFEGDSDWARGITLDDVSIGEAPTTPPSCTSNFTNTADPNCGNFDFTVSWDAVADASGYLITAGTTSGATDIADAVDLGSSTSYTFTDVSIAQDYFYTVAPYNPNGSSVGCAEQTVTTSSQGCYCVSNPSSNDGSGISSVSLAGTDYTSAGDVTYEDFTATSAPAGQSTVASLEITFATGYTYDAHVWVDFNDDYNFDESERLFSGASLGTNPTTLDASFTVPSTAPLGEHRLRITSADSGLATPNACYNGSYGVTVDMTLNVTAPPSCIAPTNFAASNVGASSVDFSWTAENAETSWEYVVQAPGTGEPTGAGIPTTENPLTVTGLTANTPYEIYLRATCDVFTSSTWVLTTFTTACDTFIAPYSQDFENAGVIPDCWSMSGGEPWLFTNSTTGTHIGNAGGVGNTTSSGGYFAYVDDSTPHSTGTSLVTPFVDVSGLTTPALMFYLLSNKEDSASNVNFSVDVYDGAAWNTGFYTSSSNTADWVEIILDLSSLSITGPIQVRFIVDEITTDFDDDVAIDDVKITELPTCAKPTDLTLDSATSDGAIISWTSNETSFNIEYGISGFTQGNGTVTTANSNSISLTGLTSNTAYDVYVQSDCGGDISEWSSPFTFTTECPQVFSAPYFNGFEDLSCWTNSSTAPWLIGTGSNYGPGSVTEGSSAVYFNVYSYQTGVIGELMSPSIDLSGLASPSLTFDYYDYTTSTLDAPAPTVEVIVNDGTTVASLTTLDAVVSEWTAITVDLSAYTGQTVQVGFRGTSDYGYSNPHIDNLKIDVSLGTNDLETTQFTYFPNPVNDQLTINAQTSVDDIAVLNMLGQVVLRQSPNSLNCVVDMAALRTGVYFVQVSIGNKTQTVRVLKQ